MRDESEENNHAKFNAWMDKNWNVMLITAVSSLALGVVIALVSRLWPHL